MSKSRSILTPDNLALLQCIAETGSFAAAARHWGLVPSALTYRVRQIEDALDVLLFDRSARQARPTQAGAELLREGARLLTDIGAVAYRMGAALHHCRRRPHLAPCHARFGRCFLQPSTADPTETAR